MSDFSARITAGANIATWTDPATGLAPSRLNPLPGRPHTYWLVDELIDPLTIEATVGGVEGPADAALGGRLFKWSWVEHPTAGRPTITPTVGSSSIVSFTGGLFTGLTGHYTILCWRDGGGAQAITFEVRP